MSGYDFTAKDGSFTLHYDRSRGHDKDGNYVYRVRRTDKGATHNVVVGALSRDYWNGAPTCWLIHDTEGNLLVSGAEGIGTGGCPTRDEAVTVLGWKMEKPDWGRPSCRVQDAEFQAIANEPRNGATYDDGVATITVNTAERKLLLESLAGFMARTAIPAEVTACFRLAQRLEGFDVNQPAESGVA